ncbi:MAG: hypothetical protein GX061_00435 [Eubacteriaceae bacterium]|nr:hypothetical protein [Eubacteriaceae bacterium]
MKKCLMGIAILLFALLFQLCSTGMGIFSLLIGSVGLAVAIGGGISSER